MSSDEAFERARDCFVQGNAAFEAGRLDEAESLYLESLRWLPGRPSTLSNLAATRIALGRPLEALEPLQQALESAPFDAQAWTHRGVALSALGRRAEAEASHARALEIDPRRTGDWSERAQALIGLKRPSEALQCLDRALSLAPDDAWLHCRRGQTLLRLQRTGEAQAALQRALDLDPTLAEAWSDLGALSSEQGRLPHALACWQQALDHGGDPELLHYQMAGVRARLAEDGRVEQTPAHPPRAYVEGLFDDYADSFDAHLQQLDYRAPQVLASGLGVALGTGPAGRSAAGAGLFRHALDLGCGTGLCAAPLGPWTLRLTGVDVSSQMLERARALERYDQLVHGDLIEHLRAATDRYDLVVAADVFIYVGALEDVFAGVRRVIEDGGVFCFSVEQIEDERDYALLPSLRYGHSPAYLRRLAALHGFEVMRLQTGPLRRDVQHEVRGLYGWFRAGGAAGDTSPARSP